MMQQTNAIQYESKSIKHKLPRQSAIIRNNEIMQDKDKMTIQVMREGEKQQLIVVLEPQDLQKAMKLQIDQIKDKAANTNYKWEIFDIKQEIGAGTFGQVFASLDQTTQKKYALKFIGYDDETDQDPDFKSAVREIVIMQQLSQQECQGLLRIFDVYPCIKDDNKYLVIVMELCDCNLMELLKVRIEENRTKWLDEELLHILRQLVEGFVIMQKQNITHRDVKPQNILYSCTDKAYKIADLGGAKFLKAKSTKLSKEELINTVRGSPAYWAPEIYYFCDLQKDKDGRFFVGKQHLPYDPFISDVYSIGITMLLMKKLQARIDRESLKTEVELLRKLKNPSLLETVLSRMLEHEERRRITLQELLLLLDEHKSSFKQPNEDVFVNCLRNTQDKKNLPPQDLMAREIKLADAYEKLNLIEHAKAHYEQALKYASKLSKDSTKADILNSLGTVHCDLGQYDEAEKYYQDSVLLYKKIHGDKHSSVADAYNNIGIVKRKKQDYEKAIKYYEQAYQIKEAVFGENNLGGALILSNIGLAYRKLGNLEQAIKYYKSALQIKKLLCGDRSLVLCSTYDNLARVYYLKQSYDLAISCYTITAEIYRKNYQTNQSRLSESLFELGLCYQKSNRIPDGVKAFDEAFSIRKTCLGQYAKQTIQTQEHYAQCLLEEGSFQKAIDLYLNLKQSYQQGYIKCSPDEKLDNLSDILKNLGAGYMGIADNDKALQSYNESLNQLEKRMKDFNSQESIRMAKIHYNIGLVHRVNKQYGEAEKYYQKAIEEIGKSNQQCDLILLGDINNNMGVLFGMQDNYQKARSYFSASLHNYIQALGKGHQLCKEVQQNIDEIDKWLQRKQK